MERNNTFWESRLVQGLRALASFAEGWSLVPSTHTSRGSLPPVIETAGVLPALVSLGTHIPMHTLTCEERQISSIRSSILVIKGKWAEPRARKLGAFLGTWRSRELQPQVEWTCGWTGPEHYHLFPLQQNYKPLNKGPWVFSLLFWNMEEKWQKNGTRLWKMKAEGFSVKKKKVLHVGLRKRS